MDTTTNAFGTPGPPAGHGRRTGRPASGRVIDDVERQCAVLDLTDAAQAATRAALCRGRGQTDQSARLDRQSQRLYARADAHRRGVGTA